MSRIHSAVPVSLAVLLPVLLGGGLASSFEPHDGGAGPWELVRVHQGITVMRRHVDGSSLHEMWGRGVVEAPIGRVLAVLEVDSHKFEGVVRCAAVREPSVPGARPSIIYDRTKAPWPVSDRDVVMRAETRVDHTRHEVRIDFATTDEPCVPPQKGAVRMPFVKGFYLLHPANGGAWTEVEYQVHADPGGALPNWIINLAAKKIPFDAVHDLRAKAPSPRYDDAARVIMSQASYPTLIGAAAARAATLPN